jgi:hypothetical protein
MNNTQFTPLTENEMITVNGGGLLDGLVTGVSGLVGGLPVVGGLLSSLLNTVTGLASSLLGGLNLPI